MHPDLVKLLELQSKDVDLLEADRALDAILAEIEALDNQLADGQEAIARSQASLADAGRRREELEAKIENYKKLEERGKQRLDLVRNPKEAQAVTAELDLARSILSKEEGNWVKLAETISGLETSGRDAEARIAEMKEAQSVAREEIATRRSAAEARRQEALAARDQAAVAVARPLRTQYERLRTSKVTRVVIALDGPACGACYTAVPLNRRTQIRAGTLIDTCESCGVILYAAETID